jgi:hypothetical protein
MEVPVTGVARIAGAIVAIRSLDREFRRYLWKMKWRLLLPGASEPRLDVAKTPRTLGLVFQTAYAA